MSTTRKTTVAHNSVQSILRPQFNHKEYGEFRLKMIAEESRLETFKTWVFDDSKRCNKAKLAEAGFYFTGSKTEPDVVTCFLCSKILDGWEEDDDPWEEHINHADYCEFAKLRKPIKKITFEQLLDLQKSVMLDSAEKIADVWKKNVADCINFITQKAHVSKK
ncbi:baculoviral IAP repeat-containing protein 5-like [Onthophagus taurus]|uniref:baculoviral IAP repeat-containing protein 5-like n=1 Tax=Onthophagus taurus TaxID=166361 RepID=UPI0039BDAF44